MTSATSAPIPNVDPMDLKPYKLIGERGCHVPGWGQYHEGDQLNWPVTYDGEPMGHRVVDVPEERRWALNPDGSTIPQRDFEDRHLRYYLERYELARSTNPAIRSGDPKLRSIPTVWQFVNVTLDPVDPSRIVMRDWEPARCRRTRIPAALAQAPVLAKPEELTARGFTPAPTEEPEPVPEVEATAPPPPVVGSKVSAVCGKLVDKRGLKNHQTHCIDCKTTDVT